MSTAGITGPATRCARINGTPGPGVGPPHTAQRPQDLRQQAKPAPGGATASAPSGGGQHPSPQRAWLFSKEGTPAKQPQVRHSAVAGGELGKAGYLSCAVLRLSALSCVRPFLSRVATRSMWALQMLPTAASDPARLVCSPLPEPLSRGDHGSCQGHPVLSCAAQMSLV